MSAETPPDVSYLFYWDDDVIPMTGHMTLGNHLDNDLMVPGEDVNDYHVRIELSDRGPVAIPLGQATLNVNGVERGSPVQLMIGDVVGIGQATLQVGVEVEHMPQADRWALVADEGSLRFEVSGEMSIGRTEASDIVLRSEHISRHHARLVEKHLVVWLQDLNSANGTKINGLPLVGGVRLYHGDQVSFDKIGFQLIGSGAELTPVQRHAEPLRGTSQPAPQSAPVDTTEFMSVSQTQEMPLTIPAIVETGAFLLGVSDPVYSSVFRLGLGRSVMGRGGHCQIQINDNTVSNEHAEISIRPEGVTITNLMSTNGTKVNGQQVTSARLHDGDVVRLGRISLVYKDVPPDAVEDHPLYGRLKRGILAGIVTIAVILVLLLMT